MATRCLFFLFLFLLTSCRFDARLPARKTTGAAPIEPTIPGSASLSLSDGPSFSYGTVVVGNSNDKTFTITNSGEAAATSLNGSFSSAHYVLKGGTFPGTGGTCTSSLSAGSACTVVGRFSPQSSGAKTDTLSLSYLSGLTSTVATRDVSGTAQTPATLTLSDSGYNYGGVSTVSFADKIFTVTNSGETIATAMVDDAFIPGTDFDFTGGTYPGNLADCGGSLAGSGTTCTVNVRFTPSGVGVKADSISISYNNGVSTVTATRTITGTGMVYGPAGFLDTSFHTDGKHDEGGSGSDRVRSVVTQTDGKLLVGGAILGTQLTLFRFLTDGVLDTSFHSDGLLSNGLDREAKDLALTSDGKILVAAGVQNAFSTTANQVYRLKEDGAFDTSFMTSGILTVTSTLNISGASVAIQTNGKFIGIGYGSSAGGPIQVKRFETDGTLDTSFSNDGESQMACADGSGTGQGRAGKVKLHEDGKIAVVGWGDTNAQTCVARMHTNGNLDTAFHTDGVLHTTVNTVSYSLSIDTASRLLVSGVLGAVVGAVIRITTNGNIDTSFSTDGQAVGGAPINRFWDVLAMNDKVTAVGNGAGFGASTVRFSSDGLLDTSFFTDGNRYVSYGGSLTDEGTAVTSRSQNNVCIAGFDPAEARTQIFCLTY